MTCQTQELAPTDGRVGTTPRQQLSNASLDRDVAKHIAALLLHYPIGQVSDGARAQMALDWLDDLREFGPAVVEESCRQWRRQPGGRRPTPGDIRALCIEERKHREWLARPKSPALPRPEPARRPPQLTDAEIADRAEWIAMKGYPDWQAYLAAIEAGNDRIGPYLVWCAERRGPREAFGFKTIGASLGGVK